MKLLFAVIGLLALPCLAGGTTKPRLATDDLRDHEMKLGTALTAYSAALKNGRHVEAARDEVKKALKGWKEKYAEIMGRIRKEAVPGGLPERRYAERVGNYLGVTMAGISDQDLECFGKESSIAEEWVFVRSLAEPSLKTRFD